MPSDRVRRTARSSMSRGLVMVLAYSGGFGAFMFVFALTVQNGPHADPLHGGLAILPMALLFLAGSLVAPRLLTRFGRAAPTHHGGVGSGALITLQQSGLALGAGALPRFTRAAVPAGA